MKKLKYILTKYETVRRTEKVEYEVEIPPGIKNKIAYADRKILEGDYMGCRVVDVCDSEMLDEEAKSLKLLKTKVKLDKKLFGTG
jgi:hypothetical protein